MAPLKEHKNVKIAFMTVVLALILFVEPVFAAKKNNKSNTSSKSSPQKQQAARQPSTPRTQRPSNAGKTRSRVITPSRSSNPSSRSNVSRPSGRGASGGTIRSSSRSPGRVVSSRQSGNKTPSRPVASKPGIISSNRRSSSNSVNNRRMTTVSSSISRRVSPNAGNRISSGKTSRIGSRIEINRPTKSTQQKSSAGRPDNRISSDRTSRIVSRIGTDRPTKSIRQNTPARSSGNRIDLSKTSRNANRMGMERHPKISVREKTASGTRQNRDVTRILNNTSNRANRKADSVNRGSKTGTLSPRRYKGKDSRIKERLLPSPRLRKSVPERQTTIVDDNNKRDRIGLGGHGEKGSLRLSYHDRPNSVRHVHRYEHVFRDWRNRLSHRIVWPKYRFVVRYDYGPWFTFRYVYPYYHRKYIFVGLGGYWPMEYRYRRYYWYGCHPYTWSGYYPIAREVKGDTNNYYTYNYYYDNGDSTAYGSSQITGTDYITPVDHNTFADVREKLAQQAAEEPALPTPADVCFEDAVKAFEVDDYDIAVERFAKAMELAPEDVVLPFAYSQALLADKRYPEAAEALRIALLNVPHDKEGVFYPRGLYSDDNTLFEQIDGLTEEAELYSYDADLQLLLGYQLLGVGEIDEAVEPLQQASLDLENATAANILLNLLEKIRVESSETENINQ